MKRKLKMLLVGAVMITSPCLFAQDSTKADHPFTLSGYVELYYQYDFNKPADNNRPGFVYSHNRHNEFNLNLGYLKGSYNTERVRANLALAAGTYMNANLAAEPDALKYVYEANAGLKLSKKKNLWFDAGIFASHIGFESAASKECWALTRSMLADNSPYYETGAKITYNSDNGKWLLSALALNGWQRIKRVDGNSLMSWGTQVQFKPSDKILLNYSTFFGTDKPDSARLYRTYHNVYGIFNVTDKLGLTVGLDIGTEEKTPEGNEINTWFSPVGILKYTLSDSWAIAGRVENYTDKNGVIIATGTVNGFQTMGYSLNIDHSPFKNVLVRLEARNFNSKDEIFIKDSKTVSNDFFITGSVAVSF